MLGIEERKMGSEWNFFPSHHSHPSLLLLHPSTDDGLILEKMDQVFLLLTIQLREILIFMSSDSDWKGLSDSEREAETKMRMGIAPVPAWMQEITHFFTCYLLVKKSIWYTSWYHLLKKYTFYFLRGKHWKSFLGDRKLFHAILLLLEDYQKYHPVNRNFLYNAIILLSFSFFIFFFLSSSSPPPATTFLLMKGYQ